MNKFLKIYKNKKVIVTGSTGFKGAWLCFWLYLLKCKVIGIGLKPERNSILFHQLKLNKKIKQYYLDIVDYKKLNRIIKKEKPDIIFHMAAQSIVSLSFKKPEETIKTNILGSFNILQTVKENKIKNLIYITSDKCYLNKDDKKVYKENDVLGGFDLYSASKASAEIIFKAYISSFFTNKKNIQFASVRAGNVIGGGDMKKNRILPDIFKSIILGSKLIIRNPKAIRPWQHVLEPLYGYLLLGNLLIRKKLKKNITPNWNFGPNTKNIKSVKNLIDKTIECWGLNKNIYYAKKNNFYEANYLRLNSNKAKKEIKWTQKLSFNETIYLTVEWYKSYQNNKDMEDITKKQILFFMNKKNL